MKRSCRSRAKVRTEVQHRRSMSQPGIGGPGVTAGPSGERRQRLRRQQAMSTYNQPAQSRRHSLCPRLSGPRRAASGHLLVTLVCSLAGFLILASAALAAKQYEPGVPVSFGEEGTGPGQLKEPTAVAVNLESGLGEGAGDVYVDDKGNNRIERFSPGGVFLGQFNG